ncbi:NAD(P)-dependent oxidoreductase [Actinoalloteichus spitiensis]|uniref:2-hydroxyacid dehydrogenase n=1 Tax=Actinoalloteichus spitiensis TaxID=252394 RepID=UPI000374CA18
MTVLVPTEFGAEVLGRIPGVAPVLFDPKSAELPPEAAEAEVLVPGFLAAEGVLDLVERLPRLRLVQLLTAGVEPLAGRLPAGVTLSSGRGAHGGSTAEWAMAVLLAIYRDLPRFQDARRRGEWDYHPTETMQGRRVLVVGAGDLGRQLERRLLAFDATCTFVARTPREGVLGLDALPGELPRHDAVVLMVPLTPETTGLVDAAFLAAMPDGAVLVNAARGPVVDTDALVAELSSGRLRAALDVTDPEPLPAGHPLWDVPGLVLTPHVGGSVSGSRERSWAVAARQIELFVAGEEPTNVVRGAY